MVSRALPQGLGIEVLGLGVELVSSAHHTAQVLQQCLQMRRQNGCRGNYLYSIFPFSGIKALVRAGGNHELLQPVLSLLNLSGEGQRDLSVLLTLI